MAKNGEKNPCAAAWQADIVAELNLAQSQCSLNRAASKNK
jgi:hypothetical protein